MVLGDMDLNFKKMDGLVTAVVQDHESGRVLMVGSMTEEAFQKTVEPAMPRFSAASRISFD